MIFDTELFFCIYIIGNDNNKYANNFMEVVLMGKKHQFNQELNIEASKRVEEKIEGDVVRKSNPKSAGKGNMKFLKK